MAVGSAYAAAFPKNTNKPLLNGNVHPGSIVEDYYAAAAVASRQPTVIVKMCRNEQLVGPDMSSRGKALRFANLGSSNKVACEHATLEELKFGYCASLRRIQPIRSWKVVSPKMQSEQWIILAVIPQQIPCSLTMS